MDELIESASISTNPFKVGVVNIPAFKAKGTVYGSNPVIGTITVTPEINGCFGVKKSLKLTVNPLDNPAFAYDDNSFCNIQADPIPLIKGTLGGYFSFTPKGLVIDTVTGKINLAITSIILINYFNIVYKVNLDNLYVISNLYKSYSASFFCLLINTISSSPSNCSSSITP